MYSFLLKYIVKEEYKNLYFYTRIYSYSFQLYNLIKNIFCSF